MNKNYINIVKVITLFSAVLLAPETVKLSQDSVDLIVGLKLENAREETVRIFSRVIWEKEEGENNRGDNRTEEQVYRTVCAILNIEIKKYIREKIKNRDLDVQRHLSVKYPHLTTKQLRETFESMIKEDVGIFMNQINRETQELFNVDEAEGMIQTCQKIREQKLGIVRMYAGLLPSLSETSVKEIIEHHIADVMQYSDLEKKEGESPLHHTQKLIMYLRTEIKAVYFSMPDHDTKEYIESRIGDVNIKYECLPEAIRQNVIQKIRSALDPFVIL